MPNNDQPMDLTVKASRKDDCPPLLPIQPHDYARLRPRGTASGSSPCTTPVSQIPTSLGKRVHPQLSNELDKVPSLFDEEIIRSKEMLMTSFLNSKPDEGMDTGQDSGGGAEGIMVGSMGKTASFVNGLIAPTESSFSSSATNSESASGSLGVSEKLTPSMQNISLHSSGKMRKTDHPGYQDGEGRLANPNFALGFGMIRPGPGFPPRTALQPAPHILPGESSTSAFGTGIGPLGPSQFQTHTMSRPQMPMSSVRGIPFSGGTLTNLRPHPEQGISDSLFPNHSDSSIRCATDIERSYNMYEQNRSDGATMPRDNPVPFDQGLARNIFPTYDSCAHAPVNHNPQETKPKLMYNPQTQTVEIKPEPIWSPSDSKDQEGIKKMSQKQLPSMNNLAPQGAPPRANHHSGGLKGAPFRHGHPAASAAQSKTKTALREIPPYKGKNGLISPAKFTPKTESKPAFTTNTWPTRGSSQAGLRTEEDAPRSRSLPLRRTNSSMEYMQNAQNGM